MITPEELDYIRTAAIGDMLGDSKALDEMGQRLPFSGCAGNWNMPRMKNRTARSCRPYLQGTKGIKMI